MNTNRKPTLTTLKSFINKNTDNLYINNQMDFDAMTDCIQTCGNKGFRKANKDNRHTENNLGISGVWVVRNSRDYIKSYNDGTFTGYEVSNCCGLFTVAIKNS